MKKDTSQLLEELKSCADFNRFYSENQTVVVKKDLSEHLGQLLETYKLKKADVVRRSELNEIYAYQIFSGVRVPERRKLLCLTIAMGLRLEDVQSVLKCCGYAQLYVKDPFDCILIFGICKGMSVAQINYLLYDYGMETLG